MENQTEIVPPENQSNLIPANVKQEGNLLSENFIESTGKQIELRARLIQTALKALKSHDIQDFDGKPYIEGEGAARIMSVIRGFKVGEAKFNIEIIHPHYFIECNIAMEFMGATTVAIGDCSTADPFFCGKDGQSGQYKKHLERTGSETMAARLILGDAKKKARENAISRGVTELLGLKGLSWDDLRQLGFGQDKAGSSVNFKKASQGGEIKTLTPAEALKISAGSIVNIRGIFISVDERTVDVKGEKKKIVGYKLSDGNGGIIVQKWGNEELSPFEGQELFCSKVKVSEYQGKKQFTAEIVELMADEKVSHANGN